MDTQQSLVELGLSERESQLYAELLELGRATPLQLSNRTGLKRSTVYLDLESLKRKRLASISFRGKRQVYVAAPPSRFRDRLREQDQILQRVLPFLQGKMHGSDAKPDIQLYEGLYDIYRVWKEAAYQHKENWYVSNMELLDTLFPQLIDEFNKAVESGPLQKLREIVSSSHFDVEYAKKNNNGTAHQIRIMPKPFEFAFDISIWGDNVGLFSAKDKFILVLTGKPIAAAFRSLYEMAWMAAKPPK